MRSQFVLVAGIAFVAATIGYMTGGSGTPVVSVAIPAVFGLVVTALGLLQASQPSKELLEYLKVEGTKADQQPEIIEYRKRSESAPLRVGVALLVFSTFYMTGVTFGAKVRIEGLLLPNREAKPFPWLDSSNPPPSLALALEWIALQSRLSDLGYKSEQISVLYAIQVAEWERAKTQARPNPNASDRDDATKGDKARSKAPEDVDVIHGDPSKQLQQGELFRDLFKQGAGTPKGNPFANQPANQFKNKGVPG